MKATIERATLLKGLSHVQSVVERRNTIPILSNVLLEATAEGGLKLMATDLDLQINETVAAAVDQPGATTVSAHTLFDIARKLPEGSQVSLAAAEGKLTIMAGRAKFQLGTLPRDDFPVIAEGELPVSFELPAETLKQIIDKTRFAISTEETRYYLNGIFWHVSDDPQPVLKAAATDGHRLARVTMPRPDGAEGMPDVIIPRKCVAELRKLLEEIDGSVGVSLSPTKIRFDLGQALLTSKLIDGTFPDYSRVIPTGNDKILKIDPRSFEEGVDRVSTIATEKNPRGEDGARPRQDHPVGDQPRKRHRGRRSPRRICRNQLRDRLQQPVSARYSRAAAWRYDRGPPRGRRRPDTDSRERQIIGALCFDADAGLMRDSLRSIVLLLMRY